jgi:hypothetical protein
MAIESGRNHGGPSDEELMADLRRVLGAEATPPTEAVDRAKALFQQRRGGISALEGTGPLPGTDEAQRIELGDGVVDAIEREARGGVEMRPDVAIKPGKAVPHRPGH